MTQLTLELPAEPYRMSQPKPATDNGRLDEQKGADFHCSCQYSSAWRCTLDARNAAFEQGLSTEITCHCPCHQKKINGKATDTDTRIAAFAELTKCSEADARAMIADGRIKP